MKNRLLFLISFVYILIAIFFLISKEVKAENSKLKDKKIISECEICYSVKPFFKEFNENISELDIIYSRNINSEYSIVIVHGTVSSGKVNYKLDIKELLRQEAFGIFVVNNFTQKHYMTIDIFPSKRFFDYKVDIEAIDEHYLIILCQGREYGDQYEKVKYFYDLKQRKIMGKFSYQKFRISSIIEFDKNLYFFGNDGNKTIIIKLKSIKGNNLDYEIIDQIKGESIPKIDTVELRDNKLILRNERNELTLSKGDWIISQNPDSDYYKYNPRKGDKIGIPFISFWVPLFRVKENFVRISLNDNLSQKFLIWNSRISAHSFLSPGSYLDEDSHSGIYELFDNEYKFYKFPNPNYELFKKYRPERVLDGYTKDSTTLEVDIGPFQLVNKKLWFGTNFYDGEGTTGLGGIGYFDFETRKYNINYLKEIADWSTSSIYVDNEHIWVGLVSYPEGATYSAGLAKYNIKGGKIIKYAVPEITNVIYRFGDKLYLGTSDGIYILSHEKLQLIGFSLDIDSKYSLYFKEISNIP